MSGNQQKGEDGGVGGHSLKELQLKVRDLMDQIGAACFDAQISLLSDPTGDKQPTADGAERAAPSAGGLPGQQSTPAPVQHRSESPIRTTPAARYHPPAGSSVPAGTSLSAHNPHERDAL